MRSVKTLIKNTIEKLNHLKQVFLERDQLQQTQIAYEPDLIPPLDLMRQEGIDVLEDWFRWGEVWSMLLRVYCGITSNSAVLEIGCGLGRTAFPLRYILSSDSSYDGFDICYNKIEFLEQTFDKARPNFRFTWANVHNTCYNSEGQERAAEYRFPYPDNSFDIVYAASVFTNILPEGAANHFKESARVLKPGGCCLFSFFLLDNYRPGKPRPSVFSRPKIVTTYHQPPEILESLIIKDVVCKFDYITVVSPEQLSDFKELVPLDKIRLVLNGIDTDYFRPGNISKEKGKFKCITVGNYLRDFKTVRKVAEALSRYKEIELHVVSSQATGVEDLANVRVHKGIDDGTLLKLYRQSDVLFLPLLQSTANNALLEGIACGLPVVSTFLPSVKAYLPGKEAILVSDNDPEQFANTIVN